MKCGGRGQSLVARSVGRAVVNLCKRICSCAGGTSFVKTLGWVICQRRSGAGWRRLGGGKPGDQDGRPEEFSDVLKV